MPSYQHTTANTFRRRCDALRTIVERAQTYPMEVWLQPDAAGRTLKERYAEVAALACQLRDEVRRRWTDLADPPAVQSAAHGDRRRRPVTALLTEISHCLRRASRLLQDAPRSARVPDSMKELMERMEALLELQPAPDPPSR